MEGPFSLSVEEVPLNTAQHKSMPMQILMSIYSGRGQEKNERLGHWFDSFWPNGACHLYYCRFYQFLWRFAMVIVCSSWPENLKPGPEYWTNRNSAVPLGKLHTIVKSWGPSSSPLWSLLLFWSPISQEEQFQRQGRPASSLAFTNKYVLWIRRFWANLLESWQNFNSWALQSSSLLLTHPCYRCVVV